MLSLSADDVNQPNFTEIQKAYYSCFKEVSAVKILIARGARKPAVVLAEKVIKKSIRFEFTDITLELARTLRLHFVNIEGNKHEIIDRDNDEVNLRWTFRKGWI